MMTQKYLKDLERIEVLIASHVNFFLCNKCNSLHTAQNPKVTSTGNVEKTNEMKEERFSEVFLEPTEISTMELFQENSRVT